MYLNWIDEIDSNNGNYLVLARYKDGSVGIDSQHDTGEAALTAATTIESDVAIVKLVSVEFCGDKADD